MNRTSSRLNRTLWVVQTIVGVPFVLFGGMKVSQPIAQLSAMMPWTGQLPEHVVRSLGVVDIAGGLGLLLPGLIGIKPDLTRAAAIGVIALQLCATVFHLSRGEAGMVPLNIVFIALVGFILWGRSTRAPLGAGREQGA